jgi:hypothetical protein
MKHETRPPTPERGSRRSLHVLPETRNTKHETRKVIKNVSQPNNQFFGATRLNIFFYYLPITTFIGTDA